MPDHYPDTTNKGISASKFMDGSSALGKESNVGKLANITRRVTIRVGKVEKRSAINAEKITKLKNITQLRKENVDKKIGGSSSGLLDSLNGINDNVNGMLAILSERQRFEKKVASDERKDAEKEGRGSSEKKLESKAFDGLKGIAKKVLAPAMTLWERLWEFLSTILLGRVAVKLWDWISDKKNQDKIKAIGRLFKDWWPAMLTGFVLFGTGMGRFIAWMGAKLVAWGWTLLKTVIPVLWKAITAMGPWGVAALAVGGTAAYLATRPNETDEKVDKSVEEQGAEETAAQLQEQQEDRGPLQRFGDFVTGAGQEREEQIQRAETGTEKRYGFFGELDRPAEMAAGGQVPGSGNSDSVSAKLTPGEFVVSAPAVQQWGADTFAAMNAMGGGGNTGSISGGFSEGGYVDVQGSGDGSTGILKMFDNAGKQVGKLYKIVSGLSGMGDVSQEDRMNISGKGYPLPDGNYKLHGFEQHGPLSGNLGGLGDWSSFIGPGSGNIGNRSGLMLHSDIDPYGTLGCIGVGLGGRAGTLEDKEFVKSYKIANPERIKIKLGGGTGSKSSRKPSLTADNSSTTTSTSPGSKTKESGGGGFQMFGDKWTPKMGSIQGYDMASLIQKSKEKSKVPPPPAKPKTTVAYDNEMAAQEGGDMLGSQMQLPAINPSAMISVDKIKTLGITV